MADSYLHPGYVSLPPYTVYMVNLDGDEIGMHQPLMLVAAVAVLKMAHISKALRVRDARGQTVLVHTQAGHTDATDEMLTNLSMIAAGQDEESRLIEQLELDVRTRRALIDHGVS